MTGVNLVEDILLKQFKRLPSWARTSVYFLMLFFFIYLSLLPTFISGECFIKDTNGALIPFRGGFINLNIAGQTIKVRINEEGVWSLPVVSKLPQSFTVYFLYEDKYYPVAIKATSLWTPGTQRVYFEDSPPRFYLADWESKNPVRYVSDALNRILTFFSPAALAQAPSHKSLKKGQIKRTEVDPLTVSVRNAVAVSVGLDTSSVTEESLIRKDLAPSIVKRIKLARDIENQFGVRISDEEWDNLYTVKDVASLIRAKPKVTKSR